MFKTDINLNLYKTFYDVAKYGSFSKAAELTYSTQPAISKSIKKLEQELDTKLFYRKQNGVELTSKGRELLFYVEKSFGSLLTAERIMLENDELSRGRISIGMPSNLSVYVLEKIMRFNKDFPNIEISILTGSTSYLLSQLDLHKIDFIIDMTPIISVNNNLTIKKLFSTNYCFASLKNKFASIKTLKDLEKAPVILPLQGTTNRDQLDEVIIRNEIEFKNVFSFHTSELITDAMLKGIGIGYILKDYIKEYINKDLIEVLEIKEQLPSTDIVIAFNPKFLTSAPKKFIDNYLN